MKQRFSISHVVPNMENIRKTTPELTDPNTQDRSYLEAKRSHIYNARRSTEYWTKLETELSKKGQPLSRASDDIKAHVMNCLKKSVTLERHRSKPIESTELRAALSVLLGGPLLGVDGKVKTQVINLLIKSTAQEGKDFPKYWQWLEKELSQPGFLLHGSDPKEKQRVIQNLQRSQADLVLKPHYLDEEKFQKFLDSLILNDTYSRPGVKRQTVETAIATHPGRDIPTATNLGNARKICGHGYPKKGSQEESLAKNSNIRFGMPAWYPNKPNPTFGFFTTPKFSDFLNLGLQQLGSCFLTKNCTLYSVQEEQVLETFKTFHQVVVAAPNFRERSENDPDKGLFDAQKAFYTKNPRAYIENMTILAHKQTYGALQSKSKTLYPGALGCGAFKNPHKLVALIHIAAWQYKQYKDVDTTFSIEGGGLANEFDLVAKHYEALANTDVGREIIGIVQRDPNVKLSGKNIFKLEQELKNVINKLERQQRKKSQHLTQLPIIQENLSTLLEGAKYRCTILDRVAPIDSKIVEDRIAIQFTTKEALQKFKKIAKIFNIKVGIGKHYLQAVLLADSKETSKLANDLKAIHKEPAKMIIYKLKERYSEMDPVFHRSLSMTAIGRQFDKICKSNFDATSLNLEQLTDLKQKIFELEHNLNEQQKQLQMIKEYLPLLLKGTHNYSMMYSTYSKNKEIIVEGRIAIQFKTKKELKQFENIAKIFNIKIGPGLYDNEVQLHSDAEAVKTFVDQLRTTTTISTHLNAKGNLGWIKESLTKLENLKDVKSALTIIDSLLIILQNEPARYNEQPKEVMFPHNQKSTHRELIVNTFQTLITKAREQELDVEDDISNICSNHHISAKGPRPTWTK